MPPRLLKTQGFLSTSVSVRATFRVKESCENTLAKMTHGKPPRLSLSIQARVKANSSHAENKRSGMEETATKRMEYSDIKM